MTSSVGEEELPEGKTKTGTLQSRCRDTESLTSCFHPLHTERVREKRKKAGASLLKAQDKSMPKISAPFLHRVGY